MSGEATAVPSWAADGTGMASAATGPGLAARPGPGTATATERPPPGPAPHRAPARSPGRRIRTAPGALLVLLAVSLFGLVGTLSRTLLDQGVTAVTLTQFRMFFGFASLSAVLAVFRRDLLRLPARSLPTLLTFGVSLGLVIYFYFMAIARLPLAIALVLQYSATAWMALGEAVARRRRPPLSVAVALVLTLGGVALTVGLRGSDLGRLDPVGLLCGLATMVTYIGYLHCGRAAGRHLAPAATTTYGALVAAALWCAVQPPWRIDPQVWRPDRLGLLVLIGVVGMAVPFALVLAALRRIGPTRVGMLSTFEIVATSAIAFAWLGQSLTAWQQLGCGSVVVGVAVCARH